MPTTRCAVPRLTRLGWPLVTVAVLGSASLGAQQIPSIPPTPNCDACRGWNERHPPFRLHGNSWYVGMHGLSALLITSPAGHILIDGALPESAPFIARNIRALGFRLEDVRVIVNSHVHFDHAGGLSALQRWTGAEVYASAASLPVLRDGALGPDDPQYGSIPGIAPVARVRPIPADDTVRVGELRLAALRTAGHTPGGTSWSWTSCDGTTCWSMVYGDSQSAISAEGFRFSDAARYPAVLADFEHGFSALERVPCDVLVTPHPEGSALWERLQRRDAGVADALRDPEGCRRYAAAARERLARRLAEERAAR